MAILSRDQLLGAYDSFNTAEVEAFGGTVLIKELSAKQQAEFTKMIFGKERVGGALAMDTITIEDWIDSAADVVSWGLAEPELTVKEIEALPAHMFTDVQEVASKILELSGLTEVEEEEAKN